MKNSIELSYEEKSVSVSVDVVPREKEMVQLSKALAKKLGIKYAEAFTKREVRCVTHLVEENKIVVQLRW